MNSTRNNPMLSEARAAAIELTRQGQPFHVTEWRIRQLRREYGILLTKLELWIGWTTAVEQWDANSVERVLTADELEDWSNAIGEMNRYQDIAELAYTLLMAMEV